MGEKKKAFCPLSLELLSPGMQCQGMERQSQSRILGGSSMRVCVFILRRTKGRKMQKGWGRPLEANEAATAPTNRLCQAQGK